MRRDRKKPSHTSKKAASELPFLLGRSSQGRSFQGKIQERKHQARRRSAGRIWRGFAGSLLLSAVTYQSASAHLGHVVERAERYLKLDVQSEAVRVVVSLSLGPTEMGRIMADADADGDGQVSASESEQYMAAWGEGLREELPIQVDGQPVEATWAEAYFDPMGVVGPRAGAVEMAATIPLAPGEHTLAFQDRMRVETFDRTDVAFRAQPGATILDCGLEQAPAGCEEHHAYGRENVPEWIAVRVAVPGWLPWQKGLAAGGGALFAFLSALAYWRSRKAT